MVEVVLIDVGNSTVKTAEVIDSQFQNEKVWHDLNEVYAYYGSIPMMISSVKKDLNLLPGSLLLTHRTKLPIGVSYETPETLGADRIAAAVGVQYLFPSQDNLVIDMGTCITMDFVDATATFQGGVISPGLQMRMKAMHSFTDALPDISGHWQDVMKNKIGVNTEQCLLSGAFFGVLNEINGLIDRVSTKYPTLNTVITGGDAHFFESYLKAHIFAGSKIVLQGLYRIWKCQ